MVLIKVWREREREWSKRMKKSRKKKLGEKVSMSLSWIIEFNSFLKYIIVYLKFHVRQHLVA